MDRLGKMTEVQQEQAGSSCPFLGSVRLMELSVKRVYATQKEDLKHAEVMTKSHFCERIDKKNSQHITNTLAQHEFVNTCSNDADDFQY